MNNAPAITATVEPKGKKFLHTVYVDGQVFATRTSAKKYAVIHIQRWGQLGDTTPMSDGTTAGDPMNFCPRYSMKPKPAGAKIEYGFCAGNVEIQEVGA